MFQLSESLSKIMSLFDLCLVLDGTLAQWKAQQKAKSKSEVTHRGSKKGATLTMARALSIFDWFAKFFHCCKEH